MKNRVAIEIREEKDQEVGKKNLNLEDIFKIYNHEVNDFVDGYFILFDIINSTNRKNEIKYKWINQFKLLYSSVKKLKEHLMSELKIEKQNIFLKIEGDSAFIFIPRSKGKPKAEESTRILQTVLSFNSMFADKVVITDALRLKVVVTYLTDIFLFKEDEGVRDVIGRGIDFSFCIEKFAKDTHLIVNEMFHNSLILPSGYRSVKIQRHIRGWGGLQTFYALYSDQTLRSMQLSHMEDNVYSEILKDKIGTLNTP